MSRDPLPEPWRTALETKGISSKRGLATKAGISPQTAKRLIDGEGSPSPATVAAVADALFDGDRNRVWDLAGFVRQDHGDWKLPPEASLLDPEQRAAVLAVVRAMLPPEQRAGDGDDRHAAPMTAPVVVPAVLSKPADISGASFIVMTKGSGKTQAYTRLMQYAREVEGYQDVVFITADELKEEDPDLYEDLAARVATH